MDSSRLPDHRISTHPGEILREDFLVPTGTSEAVLAAHLGCPRDVIADIAAEKAPVTAELAWLLSMAFGTTPDFWLNLQNAHDLTRTRPTRKIEPLTA